MMDFSSTEGNPTWCFPFSQTEWDHTPGAVQAHLLTLHTQLLALQQQQQQLQQQVDTLQGRLNTTSKTSRKPPSSDSPFQKPTRRISAGKRGARKGHPGSGPTLLPPTAVQDLYPQPCACGHGALDAPTLYHTHQVIELPPIEMEIRHFLLYQAGCVGCGAVLKADVPSDQTTGYGPRLTALLGELGGMHRNSRRLVQDFCQSVLHIPISLGALQKVIDRASQAIMPHYEAIATLARQATVGYIDETPWYCRNTLQWLWTMATDTVSLYLMHPHRSKEAFVALIDEWQGILVSDGYGVYQHGVNRRQTCLAHLIRTARGLSEKGDPALAACGAWALAELQRLCHMAKAPPSGGEWNAWYARFCTLIHRYHERKDEAGRLVRRLQREMASLWVFLCEHGVDTTNNRAERALRFGVLWRKGSHGSASDKGNRWVERTLSLRQTCRQLGQSTFSVLVDAVTSLFCGRQPDLSWLH
ncbi:MAG: IS66 family transposase [Candidatus Tectimicrobiota bacterium]